MLEKLNRMFKERYKDLFLELNENMSLATLDGGVYSVPSITVGPGGGTILVDINRPVQLNPPASVSVTFKSKLVVSSTYRIAIPLGECEVAAKNPAYFNYLFDRIMAQGIANYNATFGGPAILRFGTTYCEAKDLFENVEGDIELRLTGNWASDKELPVVTMEKEEGA